MAPREVAGMVPPKRTVKNLFCSEGIEKILWCEVPMNDQRRLKHFIGSCKGNGWVLGNALTLDPRRPCVTVSGNAAGEMCWPGTERIVARFMNPARRCGLYRGPFQVHLETV